MIPLQHPCEICRKYVDPASDGVGENLGTLDLLPFCAAGSIWFMDTRPDWHCHSFEREPGDQ
jgi:hypothetical protein